MFIGMGDNMLTITILKGLPASGKSTWAKEKIAKSPGTHKRVNKDDLRAMLDSSHWSKGNEKFVLDLRDEIIRRSLYLGKHVIVDDTNLHPKHEINIRKLADDFEGNVQVKIMEFSVPLQTCIDRDMKRANSVGEKVIRKMYNQFLAPELEKVELVEYDNNLPDCIIIDIDGTIAEKGDRSPFDWKKVGLDKPKLEVLNVIRNYFHSLNNGKYGKNEVQPFIFSGRDSVCKPETINWLNEIAEIDMDYEIHMRAENDMRKDTIVKKELYEEFVKGKYNVLSVFDDRNCVVEMWRSIGLTCLQVADGDF